jgi:multiple sugar transport system permease protein
MTPRAAAVRVLFAALVSLVGALFALPMMWLVLSPWNPNVSLTVRVPSAFSFANFQLVFANTTAMRGLVNSIVMCGGTMVLVTLFATLAAYALSRARIPHYQLLTYGLILFSSIDSGTAAIVPLFLLAGALHLVDTYQGVILVSTGGAIPAAIFLMRGYLENLPRSYEESSLVCGAGPLRTLRSVVVPLLRPGMMVIAVYTFVGAWGSFLTPFVILRSADKIPASVAIYSFYHQQGLPQLPLVAAYSVLYAAPVVALYLFVNWRYGFRFFGGIRG